MITTVQGTAVANTPFDYATVSGHIDSTISGAAPITETNNIDFGSGVGNLLHVGGFGYVNSVVTSAPGGLDVHVDNNGQLFLASPVGGSVNVHDLIVANGGTLGLTITQVNTSSVTPVVLAGTNGTTNPTVTLTNAYIGFKLGGFISSGTTVASTSSPTPQVVTLISSPTAINDTSLAQQNANLSQLIPFLFESQTDTVGNSAGVPDPISFNAAHTDLILTLLPRSTGATNADGTPGLNLSGDAKQVFPFAAAALQNDPLLGEAIGSNMTIYKTNGVPTSGINVAASQQQAEQIFSQMTPDVSGGTRQVAILHHRSGNRAGCGAPAAVALLCQPAGRTHALEQRICRQHQQQGPGGRRRHPHQLQGSWLRLLPLGLDAGSAQGGWYGGAISFYSGDVSETLPRDSLTHEDWYMLTGYTDWRGKHVFIDTTGTVGYGTFNGNRTLVIGDQSRDAVGKRAGLLGALGATSGVFLKYGFPGYHAACCAGWSGNP